jgi:hypothetical protein
MGKIVQIGLASCVLVLCSLDAAGQSQLSFSSHIYPLTQPAAFVSTADFNRDKVLDIAVLNVITGGVTLVLSRNDGSWSEIAEIAAVTPQPFPVYGFTGVWAADFDSDGKMDLLVTDASVPAIIVLLGNGDGTFGKPIKTELTFLTAPGSVVGVADLNGDGKPDIALWAAPGNQGLGPLTLLGNGDGTFAEGPSLAAGVGGEAAAMADFNGDGKPGIVVPFLDGWSPTLLTFLGNGDGSFQPPLTTPAQTTWTSAMLIADFNHDGKTDLVSTSYQGEYCEFKVCRPVGPPGALAVLLADGTGAFGGPGVIAMGDYGQPIVGDFDGDGNSDVAVDSGIYLGDGAGAFPKQIALSFGDGGILASADLNGDGLTDIIRSNSAGLQVEMNMTPGFSMSSTVSQAQVTSGASVSYEIGTGQQNGFAQSVALTCDAPSLNGISCSMSPSSVAPGKGATLMVTTTGSTAAQVQHASPTVWEAFLVIGICAAVWPRRRTLYYDWPSRRLALRFVLIATCTILFQTACGSGNSTTKRTPSGKYSITVTGVAGSLQRSVTVILTVQ